MTIKEILQRQVGVCLKTLSELIIVSPGEIWEQRLGGFIYWHQIYHVLNGAKFWFGSGDSVFDEPRKEMRLYPDLDGVPESVVSKDELLAYHEQITDLSTSFFNRLNEACLTEGSETDNMISNLEVVCIQIRHLEYHIGHCSAILRNSGYGTAAWRDSVGRK